MPRKASSGRRTRSCSGSWGSSNSIIRHLGGSASRRGTGWKSSRRVPRSSLCSGRLPTGDPPEPVGTRTSPRHVPCRVQAHRLVARHAALVGWSVQDRIGEYGPSGSRSPSHPLNWGVATTTGAEAEVGVLRHRPGEALAEDARCELVAVLRFWTTVLGCAGPCWGRAVERPDSGRRR